MTAREGPLAGMRIVDWTIWQHGPVAAAMLGDLGADTRASRSHGPITRGVDPIDMTLLESAQRVRNAT